MSRITLLKDMANHLAKQRRIANDAGTCQYRDHAGNMCAIGGVIPKELYSPMLEGKDINSMFIVADGQSPAYSKDEKAANLAVVNWLCEQMPEITDRAVAQTVLFAAQRYHDDTAPICYETQVVFAANNPELTDEELSTRIYAELKDRTDSLV
jgi:hypothetical protein